jgi:ATP-binding cassette subfamily B protein
VIVNADDSFVADVTGIDRRWGQLVALARRRRLAARVGNRVGYQLAWRNLAQTVEHEARMDAYSHVQSLELGLFRGPVHRRLMAVLNDDVNQLERFLDVGRPT